MVFKIIFIQLKLHKVGSYVGSLLLFYVITDTLICHRHMLSETHTDRVTPTFSSPSQLLQERMWAYHTLHTAKEIKSSLRYEMLQMTLTT